MKRNRSDLITALLPLVLIPLAYAGLWLYRSRLMQYVNPCPLRLLLGVYCPGCGGTHSVFELSRGHILHAARYNLLVVIAALYLLMYWLQSVLALFGLKKKLIPASRAFWLTVAGIAVAYVILRNIFPVLAPI